MRTVLLALALGLTLAAGASAAAAPRVAIFYYPWYGNPFHDATFLHWEQGGHAPPYSIAASFFPARGFYSSSDRAVIAAHMREIASAGVDQVVTSWWGRGSVEDARLPATIAAARRRGLAIAIHLEPYAGRTAASTRADIEYLRRFGIVDFYVYDPVGVPDADWAAMNDALRGVHVFANTPLVGRAAAGHFDGVYTYDVLIYDGSSFHRLCDQAARRGLLCAPSVGPGYDARRTTGDPRVKPRRNGRRYDHMWRAALRANPDIVTITSYNEWHEGTQIEPAWSGAPSAPYLSYDGAYGKHGRAAERAYLERTAYWAKRFADQTALR